MSRDSPYPELKQALDSNPLRVVLSRVEALSMVENDNALLFQQVDEGSYYDVSS